jgi:ankyrin repeat domain-containing protein 17
MEVIRVAKDRQAAEAAKNASSLLEELDREKNLEESKKAAAARKREKKKRKKLERQMKCGSVTKDENEKAENQVGNPLWHNIPRGYLTF